MTMRWIFLVGILALTSTAASAQTQTEHPWRRSTTLTVFGGAATASPNTTGTFGTAIGWEMTHRFEIEGAAAWLSKRRGAQAFAADLKLDVNLTRPAPIVPFVGGGIGLYRGTFDASMTAMPNFYRRRMADSPVMWQSSYTDPTAVIAAGAHLYVARHVSIRPEAMIRFVMDDDRNYRVGTVTVGVVYHIEEHVPASTWSAGR
jgi:hypothetical protein